MAFVLLERGRDASWAALVESGKLSVFVDSHTFSEVLAFANVDIQEAINEQVVNLSHSAFAFQAEVMNHGPIG